jgi:hypothetical protein
MRCDGHLIPTKNHYISKFEKPDFDLWENSSVFGLEKLTAQEPLVEL